MFEAGVALGLQQVVAEVHDHEPGEGVEQPAADHAQLVVVQPQLLQPREQRRGQRHDTVTCNIRTLLARSWKVLYQFHYLRRFVMRRGTWLRLGCARVRLD